MTTLRPVTLLLAAMALHAGAASAGDLPSASRDLGREIQMCVSRIADKADYSNATRVVHRVVTAEQKNLVEQKFRIDTVVLADDDNVVIRAYNATCVTMGPLKIVSFKIDLSAGSRYSAAL